MTACVSLLIAELATQNFSDIGFGQRMGRPGVRRGFAGVAMGMEMHRAAAMNVFVEMHPVAPQLPQHVRAEADQHHSNGGLDRPVDALRDCSAEQDGGAGKDEQRQRVAEPPGQPVLDDIGHMAAARGDAGYGGDMIGLERMLHAQQKP